jgi:hypothetical protein
MMVLQGVDRKEGIKLRPVAVSSLPHGSYTLVAKKISTNFQGGCEDGIERIQIHLTGQAPVAHACNPSYSGGSRFKASPG